LKHEFPTLEAMRAYEVRPRNDKRGVAVLAAFATLIAACSPSTNSRDINVEVKRELTVKDELLSAETTWSMTVSPRRIYFGWMYASAVSSGSPEDNVKMIDFDSPETAARVMSTFSEWDRAATQNNVEPFTKAIQRGYTFKFSNGSSNLEYVFRTLKKVYDFDRTDIQNFNELLKQFPEAKAELDSKVQKAEREATLFQAPTTSSPSVEVTPVQAPRFVTLVQGIPITAPSGQVIQLGRGTRLEFVSQEGSQIRIRYAGTEYLIPVDLVHP
jgi:hypothetical protein